MSTVAVPARRWGPKERPVAVKPTGIVSNLDPAPLPHVVGAMKLADAARGAGWWVRTGYAKVAWPDQWYENGNLRKAAHLLESVCVQFLRLPPERGWAIWHSVDGGSYRFIDAYVGMTRHGWRATAKTPSILDKVVSPA